MNPRYSILFLLLSLALPVPLIVRADDFQLSATAPSTVGLSPDGTATDLMPYPVYGFSVQSLAFSPDGKTLATGDGTGNLRFWDVATGELKSSVHAHEGWVFSIAWVANGKQLVTGGKDRLIQIRDAAHPGPALKTLQGHSNDVHAVALSADNGTLVSAGDDRTVRIWDIGTSRAIRTLTGHEKTIPTTDVSSRGMIASGSRDQTIRLWDLKTGNEVGVLRGHVGDVMSVRFSADGKLLASASYDQTVRLWDMAAGTQSMVLTGHTFRVYSVAFAPNGKELASAGDHTARTWELATGRNSRTFALHSKPAMDRSQVRGAVSAVAYSPVGRVLAIASTLGTVHLVSTDTGATLHNLTPTPPAK